MRPDRPTNRFKAGGKNCRSIQRRGVGRDSDRGGDEGGEGDHGGDEGRAGEN